MAKDMGSYGQLGIDIEGHFNGYPARQNISNIALNNM